jgi:hypothetical protein
MKVMRSRSVGGRREGYDGGNSRLVLAKTNPISVALANIVALARNVPEPETSNGQDIEGI